MRPPRFLWTLTTTFAMFWCLLACGGGGGSDGPPERAVVDLAPNETVTANLTAEDEPVPDGTWMDLYRVTLTAPGTLSVRLASAEFDAYLYVFAGEAIAVSELEQWQPFLVAEDDDSGGGSDAEISLELEAGSYLLAANSFEPAFGTYTLSVTYRPTSSLPRVGTHYLQYRAYEGGIGNRFQAWVQLVRDGDPVSPSEVSDVRVSGPDGVPLTPTNSGFHPGEYLFLNCSADPCLEEDILVDRGLWATYPTLAAGTHTLEVPLAQGQSLNLQIDYSGPLALPFVPSADVQVSWSGDDLVLGWQSRASSLSWGQVERLYLVLFDALGKDVLYVRLPATATGVTLPGILLARAAALGNGALQSWEVQTRAYDANAMNYARGYSLRLPLP